MRGYSKNRTLPVPVQIFFYPTRTRTRRVRVGYRPLYPYPCTRTRSTGYSYVLNQIIVFILELFKQLHNDNGQYEASAK